MGFRVEYPIDEYVVTMYTKAKSKSNYGPQKITITLFSAGTRVAYLYFYPGDGAPEHDWSYSNGAWMRIYFDERDYDRVLDLLRNESPVFVRFRSFSNMSTGAAVEGLGEIATGEEEVGGEETEGLHIRTP